MPQERGRRQRAERPPPKLDPSPTPPPTTRAQRPRPRLPPPPPPLTSHAQALGAASHLGADLAKAHDGQGLAHHAHAHPFVALPAAGHAEQGGCLGWGVVGREGGARGGLAAGGWSFFQPPEEAGGPSDPQVRGQKEGLALALLDQGAAEALAAAQQGAPLLPALSSNEGRSGPAGAAAAPHPACMAAQCQT